MKDIGKGTDDERQTRLHVVHVAVVLLAFVGVLALYICYLQTFGAEKLAHHPLNQRSAQAETEIQRGSLLDAKGRALAQSTAPGQRSYPMGAAMAPVTGYIGERIGSAGLEGRENQALLGRTDEMNRLGPVAQLLQSERGNDVHTTINADVQQAAYDAFAGRRGAAVVLDATTGAVLAMVSWPSYDPARVEDDWDSLREQADGPLLNRVRYGMYPPGSTIKPMMADAALAASVTNTTETFDCDGVLDVGGGQSIREAHGEVHGNVNLEEAVTESCNVTFGKLAVRMGAKKLGDAFERFGFTKELTGDLASEAAHLPDFSKLGKGDTAQVGIGQSSLLVTPMEMALVAAAFANGGVVMQPYLVQSVTTPRVEPFPVSMLLLTTMGLSLTLFWTLTLAGCWTFRNSVKERDDFVAATAHDLTTPLVALRRLIGRDDVEAKVLAERMMRLVKNLTDFLKLGGRRPGPELRPIDLRKAYEEAYALFRDDYRWHFGGKDVATEGPAALMAEADETMAVQILWNLLANDLKYAAPCGSVAVRFAASGAFVTVSFADTGRGLPAAERKRIFDRYYRVQSVMTSGKGGFGIGLCTAREFARAMGGDLTVAANEPQGCVFTLKLRRAK